MKFFLTIVVSAFMAMNVNSEFPDENIPWGTAPFDKINITIKDSFAGQEFLIGSYADKEPKFYDIVFESLFYRYNSRKLTALTYVSEKISIEFYEKIKKLLAAKYSEIEIKENVALEIYQCSWKSEKNKYSLEYFSEDYEDNEPSSVKLTITPL